MNKALFPLAQLYDHEANHADRIYLRQPINGVWHEFTWRQVMDQARRMAAFLQSLGLKKGDRVAILSKSCAHWFMADFAIMLAGFVSVPLYYNQNTKDIGYILQHADAKAIFVGKLDNWAEQEKAIPFHIERIAFPYENPMPAKYQWSNIIAETAPLQTNHMPKPDDIFTIFYTSGTTGTPKGAFYTYGKSDSAMTLWNEDTAKWNLPIKRNLFCYLPLAHCFERIAIEFWSLYFDTNVSFPESIKLFPVNLREVSPTIFCAVPRIWQVFQSGILNKVSQSKLNIVLNIPILSGLIKKKIKHELGLGNAFVCVSGAAPLPSTLLLWYKKLGITIIEGYGQTENFIYATINSLYQQKPGSVGIARDKVELKIGENEELLIRSPSLMDGYYLDPKQTAETIDAEGFLHSGDKAEIDDDGFVFITGRLKDQFKTAKGEFIVPTPIELAFAHNPDIEQCCLIGSDLKQPVLVANLSAAAKLKTKEFVNANISATLFSVNQSLPHYQRVSKVY
ncbi:MAG: AMP-binding protein, partial [Pseudomonadota bacterium]|nr:AMP-binding protein [Pseudomonadota bacterium]